MLLTELALEDIKEYISFLRLILDNFDYHLQLISYRIYGKALESSKSGQVAPLQNY